jgi:hypothetical protein
MDVAARIWSVPLALASAWSEVCALVIWISLTGGYLVCGLHGGHMALSLVVASGRWAVCAVVIWLSLASGYLVGGLSRGHMSSEELPSRRPERCGTDRRDLHFSRVTTG